MKSKNTIVYFLFFIGIIVSTLGCKKYLDAKPDKKLVIPEKIEDLQALLDRNSAMNRYGLSYGEGSSDNFYLTNTIWSGLNEANRNIYLWEEQIEFEGLTSGWGSFYQMIYYANATLENINKIEHNSSNKIAWENVKGSALFFRGLGFFSVASTWSKGYDQNTAASDLGIPLRLNSDFNETSLRSSVKNTYEQILADAAESVQLLPIVPAHIMRPSRPAAYALLSRTYLAMQQFEKAGAYADSCLQLFNTMLDYNALNANASFPISRFNEESIFFNEQPALSLLTNTRANVDSILYQSYEINDLRKEVFFKNNGNGSYSFKGNYTGGSSLFDGFTTSEVLLTRAECLARQGKLVESLKDLNDLLRKRFKTGTYADINVSGTEVALQLILAERRKELLMRNLRWMDIKRLNKEPGRETTLKRIINNQTYILPPNDNRYALPIPRSIITISKMQQNPR